MRNSLLGISLLCLAVTATACAGLQPEPSAQVDNNAGVTPLPPYSGPRARIAVADFDVKAAKAYGEIGTGLRDMLVTALVNSNRFRVVERQVLNAVMQEQQLAASGAAAPGQGAQKGQIKTADIIITAAVTEFEPEASGQIGGFGGGGTIEGTFIGALFGGKRNKAHMALDIRIIDSSTSEVLAATRVQGQATDVAGLFVGVVAPLGVGLAGYANTPMEKAIRVCILEAVKYIAQVTPANYFKY